MAVDSLISILEDLKMILLEEKDSLVKQEGASIQDIVVKKEAIVEKMEQAKLKEEEKEAVHALVLEVKILQETNNMLTKQAMTYNVVFLKAFQEAAKKTTTYLKVGNVNQYKTGQSGIIDQSI